MNFHAHLLEFLKVNGQVSLPNFGTFYLKNIAAIVDQKEQSISPPGKEITFSDAAENESDHFAKFLSSQKKVSLQEAQAEIIRQISFWNSTLEKEKEIVLENLGTFFLTDQTLHFKGNQTENLSPDSYGLEEIDLTQIKKTGRSSAPENDKNSYRFSPSNWWVLLLLAGIAALTYFGITQPEAIFGKRSFQNLMEEKAVPQKTNTSAIEKSLLALQDSARLNTAKLDSLKTDSLKTDSIKAAVIPVKSAPKTYKNYSKSK